MMKQWLAVYAGRFADDLVMLLVLVVMVMVTQAGASVTRGVMYKSLWNCIAVGKAGEVCTGKICIVELTKSSGTGNLYPLQPPLPLYS